MIRKTWSIDTLALIFFIIVGAQILTYIVPQGEFERKAYLDQPEQLIVVPGSFKLRSEEQKISLKPWHLLLAIPAGFSDAQGIIFLLFIVGGVLAIIKKTGAIDTALKHGVDKFGDRPWLLIAGCMLMFSIGSYTIGMGEEYVPLIPIIVTLCLAMKMDAIVAMGMVWISYGIGWACAGVNPFSVIIAQNIANLPITSGWAFRLVMMSIFLCVGFHHLYRYAKKVIHDPNASLVAKIDYSDDFDLSSDVNFTKPRAIILLIFVFGIIGFVYGVTRFGWYISELQAIFLGIGLIAAFIARLSVSQTSKIFVSGASEMMNVALIVGFARTISIILSDGQIIDTVVDSLASILSSWGAEFSAIGMLFIQTLCNVFIPSGSGQAYFTMPIMSPLATLTGVPQQTAVLAFQFGDGFTNMINPTSAEVMGALAIGRVPYSAWVRFVVPLLVKFFALAMMFLIFTIHYGDIVGF